MGKPNDWGLRPGRPGQYGPGNEMYDNWANQTVIDGRVQYTHDNGKTKVDTSFYTSSQFYDEYMKKTGTKNLNSAKDARQFADWVSEEKGVDIYKQYGEGMKMGDGEEEEQYDFNTPVYERQTDFTPESFNYKAVDRKDDNIVSRLEREADKIERQAMKSPEAPKLDFKPTKVTTGKPERSMKQIKKDLAKASKFNPDPLKFNMTPDSVMKAQAKAKAERQYKKDLKSGKIGPTTKPKYNKIDKFKDYVPEAPKLSKPFRQ